MILHQPPRLVLTVALASAGCAGLWGFDDLKAGDAGTANDGGGTGDAGTGPDTTTDAPPSNEPPTNGLVGYWTFDNAGTTADDSSGNNNNGTVTGVTQVAGKVGLAYQFDGGGRVGIPDSPSLAMDGGSTLTMMAWVSVMPCPQFDSGINRGTVLGKTGEYEHSMTCGSSPNYQEAIATVEDRNWFDEPGAPISTATSATWHHVATTWDAQTVYQYIDGVQVGSRPLPGGSLSPTAIFGMAYGVGIGCGDVDGVTGQRYWFVGALDEVALYNRALSASEIQGYYAATESCAADLSNVGAADFHISFTLTTDAGAVDMALLNQRTGCDETSTWWDVSYIPSTSTMGALQAATDDGTHYIIAEQAAGAAVDDGKPHRIVVARTSGQLGFSIDGVAAAGPVPDPYSFGPMPPPQIGTAECPGFGPTIGSITNLCITTP